MKRLTTKSKKDRFTKVFVKGFFLLLCCIFSISVYAQVQVDGVVKDTENLPLIGATVVVKNTDKGTVTDVDGNFSITVPDSNATLKISYVGYLDEEISLNGSNNVEITLVPDVTSLDDVVVIGYGSQRKRDLTGAVATVDNERLQDIPSNNLTSTLQGSVPGMSINTPTGAPGAESDILIRGVKSLMASNEPLVVIDGILGASIDDINPNDIKDIQVLKDAAAASIYGSRASGGVIIITTKRGEIGKVNVSYNGYYGFSDVANKVDVLTADEYVAKKREIYRMENSSINDESFMSYEESQDVPIESILAGNELEMYNMGQSYNWLEEVTRDAPIQGHSLRLSGGNEKTQYYLSANMVDQTGIIRSSNFDRQSVRANVSSKFTDWIEAGTNILVSNSNQQDAADIFEFTYQLSPLGKKYEDEEDPDVYELYPMYPDEYIANPFTELEIINKTKRTKFLNSTFVELTPFKGFTYRVSLNTVMDYRKYNNFTPRRTRLVQAFLQYENAAIEYEDQVRLNFDNLVSYHKAFGQHRVTGTVVFSTEEYKRDKLWAYGENFGTDYYAWTALGNSQVDSRQLDSDEERSFLMSYIGRLNYSFDDKYLLQLSARNDRSSKFSEENRDAFFPSASLGWVVSDEPFMSGMTVLNNLKFRLSWAKTGNQAIHYHDRYNTGEVIYYTTGQDGLGTILDGLVQTSLANKDLRWEISTETNIGVNFQLFDSRLSGGVDLYKTITTDMLWQQAISTTTGFESIRNNIGSLENRGIEASLNGLILNKSDFTLSANATFSANKNKILDLDGTKTDNVANRLFIGEPVGVVYDYVFDGVLQEGEEAPEHMPDLLPGEVKVKDIGSFAELDDESQERTNVPDTMINEADQTIIGQIHPKWYGSFGLNITYKKFDLSVFINHVNGVNRQIPVNVNARPHSLDIPYYTDENPSTQYGRPSWPRDLGRTGNQYEHLSYYVDGSYTRLQDVTLGYNLSGNLLTSAGISRVRLYVTGQNLLTFTDYIGYDPAVAFEDESGDDTNQTGADIAKLDSYPTIRNFIMGVNVTF